MIIMAIVFPIIKSPNKFGDYATIVDTSYGKELEIQYFEQKFGKWVLKNEGNIDSRFSEGLLKVNAVVDGRYTFLEDRDTYFQSSFN